MCPVRLLAQHMQATSLVLHWGVRKGRKGWAMPPLDVRPPGTQETGEIAAETELQPSEKTAEVSGQDLHFQTLQLTIPPKAEVTGLTFVMRSADRSAWFRDGRLIKRTC